MPERAKSLASKSLASVFIAGTFALAALPGVYTAASAAAECLESPDLHISQPGRWSYHTDRSLNRRCWHFDPAEATAATQAVAPATAASATTQVAAPATAASAATQAAPPATTANENSQQSFFARFAPGLSQVFSPPPQPYQNSIPDNSGEASQAISSRAARPLRTVRRDQPKTAPPPATNGAATAERRDQPRQPAAAEKNEKRDLPSDVAEREALFQDFVKWQTERTVFGWR